MMNTEDDVEELRGRRHNLGNIFVMRKSKTWEVESSALRSTIIWKNHEEFCVVAVESNEDETSKVGKRN